MRTEKIISAIANIYEIPVSMVKEYFIKTKSFDKTIACIELSKNRNTNTQITLL